MKPEVLSEKRAEVRTLLEEPLRQLAHEVAQAAAVATGPDPEQALRWIRPLVLRASVLAAALDVALATLTSLPPK